MYFFLANMLAKFSYLEYNLITILSFVGLKMLLQLYRNARMGFLLLLLRYLLLRDCSFIEKPVKRSTINSKNK
jgi:tellurite resistance protein TerC